MPRDPITANVRDFEPEQQRGVPTMFDAPFSEAEAAEFEKQAKAYVLLNDQKARIEEQQAEIKKYLHTMLERAGEPYGDQGQHRAWKLPQVYRNIRRIIRQTKVIQSVDVVAAEAIARQKDLYDRWFPPKPTLDESAVWVALEEDTISEEEFRRIFPKKNQYAISLEKDKKK